MASTALQIARPRRTLLARAAAALRRAAGREIAGEILPDSPFVEWTFEDAEAAVDKALEEQTIDTSDQAAAGIQPVQGEANFRPPRARQDPIAINRAFFEGDHWQNGSGYIGPHPQPQDVGYNDTMAEIANIFTSQNAVREVTIRHTLGVLGKAFRWSFVPRRDVGEEKATNEEQAAIDEATGILRRWLLARKVPTLLRDAVETLLLAERSAVRLHVPAGLARKNAAGESIVSAKSIEEALAKIWPEHPTPETSAVAVDDDTKLEAGVVLYESENDAGEAEEYAWLCFLDQVGETVIKIINADEESSSSSSSSISSSASDMPADGAEEPAPTQASIQPKGLPLGGRLTMFEMRRPALITPQVQQNQRALNFALTMVPRNVTTGGFLERLLLDAQAPGHWEVKDGVRTGKFIPEKLQVGAGTTNFFEGVTWQDEKGDTHHAEPSAVFREPVKPDASLTAKDSHYRAILAETGQLHVVISGDATASAVARIQARSEFLATLLLTQPEIEAAIRWILETALALAEAIAGTPGKYTNVVRAQVAVKLDAGPLTPEERGAIESSIGKTISQETAMLLLGVDDVDAEKAKMAGEPLARATLGKAIGDALTSLTSPGATLAGAAAFLGLEAEDLGKLHMPPTTAPMAGAADGGSGPEPTNGSPGTPPATKGEVAAQNGGAKQGSSSSSAPGGEK